MTNTWPDVAAMAIYFVFLTAIFWMIVRSVR